MSEWIIFIDMIVQVADAAQKIKLIAESEGREPTPEEWEAILGRMDASTSGWVAELQRRREAADAES